MGQMGRHEPALMQEPASTPPSTPVASQRVARREEAVGPGSPQLQQPQQPQPPQQSGGDAGGRTITVAPNHQNLAALTLDDLRHNPAKVTEMTEALINRFPMSKALDTAAERLFRDHRDSYPDGADLREQWMDFVKLFEERRVKKKSTKFEDLVLRSKSAEAWEVFKRAATRIGQPGGLVITRGQFDRKIVDCLGPDLGNRVIRAVNSGCVDLGSGEKKDCISEWFVFADREVVNEAWYMGEEEVSSGSSSASLFSVVPAAGKRKMGDSRGPCYAFRNGRCDRAEACKFTMTPHPRARPGARSPIGCDKNINMETITCLLILTLSFPSILLVLRM